MTKATGKAKQTLRAAKDNKRKNRQVVWIGGDEELATKLREAEGRRQRQNNLVDVRGDDATDADRLLLLKLEEEVEGVRSQLRDTSIKFVLESIGRKRYDKMMAEHPPTKEQMDQAEKEGESITFNPETFPFELIDACTVEPEHEPGELQAWMQDDESEEWNNAEVVDLFNAAVAVNMSRLRLDLGKG